jgi:16S rRNA (guanine527-N7)-methyltransferase
LEFFNKKNQSGDNKPKDLWRIREWFPELSEDVERKLKIFHEGVMKSNGELNLVPVKTLPQCDLFHFADCILGVREIIRDHSYSSILDIGNGNGFPGFIMAALYPNIRVSIYDLNTRRLEFLQKICAEAQIKNIETVLKPLDEIPVGTIEVAMTRGFAPIPKALLALRKHFKKNGVFYMLKGEEWPSEVSQIPAQLCSHWLPSLAGEYKLPSGELRFGVVKIVKTTE